MNSNVFEERIKPLLLYVGTIGAIISSCAYIVLIVTLINGFQVHNSTTTITFACINAVVGMLIANFLRYQGISFAANIDTNKELVKAYYGTKTTDKKNHSLRYFWARNIVTDIFTKGCTMAITTMGLIYIIIVGSKDWSLLLLAFVNLALFICFGLIALDKAYDYYNNVYVAYLKEQLEVKKNYGNDGMCNGVNSNSSVCSYNSREPLKIEVNKDDDSNNNNGRGDDILFNCGRDISVEEVKKNGNSN